MALLCHTYALILWHTDLLLDKDLETDSETAAITKQQCHKHTSTVIELLLEIVLCRPLLGSCDSWTTAVEAGAFCVWSVPRSYLEDKWNGPVSC
jgi:hypothetical protein